MHSFEEDTEGVAVYRPTGYDFPLARGRRALEFTPDGTFVDHPIGRGDAPATAAGRWRTTDGRRFVASFGDSERPDREVEILHCDDTVLRIRA
ncbi:hypothetical protein LRS74_07440 [Streptomyces sp. LX-29]|uniref:hypothetical protein n=1 Tax=Streptomyces sp. LX-29 TaxID=2900152 RepID=UPI00240E6230|nr:hypothetical protein [Streptomyces sp. LX-29]WFB06896.1 hypothetical protein LRS74_07440 [Streptomyces sp. LX-29]